MGLKFSMNLLQVNFVIVVYINGGAFLSIVVDSGL